MSSIGLIFGFSGIKTAARTDYAKVMSAWIPYLELAGCLKEVPLFLAVNETLEETSISDIPQSVMPWLV